MNWETVIGLEVHAQLSTRSKLFSSAPVAYGAAANSQTSFIDAGLPGVLPVLNQAAVHMAIQFGLAIQAEINQASFFERKNYFYPDLPKGYQISQFQRPIIGQGCLAITTSNGTVKKIDIIRAHLEEDAGKSLHEAHPSQTGIDLNRAGTPLLEIVTAPCITSAEDAVCYLKTLHQLLRFLNICDGNMQEGSFRCDVNISIRPKGTLPLGTRTELKNLNSFRFIEKAIDYEIERHQTLLEMGQSIQQETRLYCPDTNRTETLRSKENENDYRYFPDPDLLPIVISPEALETIATTLPELPSAIRERLLRDDQLSEDDIDFLLTTPAHIQFYDAVKKQSQATPKLLVNWLKGTYTASLNDSEMRFDNPPVSANALAKLLNALVEKRLSTPLAKSIFTQLLQGKQDVEALIQASGYQPTDYNALITLIQNTIASHPQQAADYRAGKQKLLAFFVGQIMKQTKGQADPEQVNTLLRQYLTKP